MVALLHDDFHTNLSSLHWREWSVRNGAAGLESSLQSEGLSCSPALEKASASGSARLLCCPDQSDTMMSGTQSGPFCLQGTSPNFPPQISALKMSYNWA